MRIRVQQRIEWRAVILLALALALVADTPPGAASGGGDAEPLERAPRADDGRVFDLAKRLQEDGENTNDGELMSEIVSLMDAAHRRLYREFDPGKATQAVQARITARLGDAINIALAQRSLTRSVAPREDEARRMKRAKGQRRRDPRAGNPKVGGQKGRGDRRSDERPARTTQGGAIVEKRRGWGHLPPRDREEIIQGLEESSLDTYRDMIERYYRALSETQDP